LAADRAGAQSRIGDELDPLNGLTAGAAELGRLNSVPAAVAQPHAAREA
jgi:hypothetical protein